MDCGFRVAVLGARVHRASILDARRIDRGDGKVRKTRGAALKNKEKRRMRDLEGFGDNLRPVLGRKTEGEREAQRWRQRGTETSISN